MKKTTKILALFLAAVLLVGASVMGTLAYLTSTETVNNTFTIGQVKIDLDEAKVDTNGKAIAGETRVKENEYKLFPGHDYDKDPTVTVKKDSEACFIRLKVTIEDSKDVDALVKELDAQKIKLNQIIDVNNTVWEQKDNVEGMTDSGVPTRTYTFWYKNNGSYVHPAVTADTKLAPIFTEIKVPGVVTNEQLATLDNFKISVVAEAIQADGFTTADAAWTAFASSATTTNP